MKCHQAMCGVEAQWLYTWPGKDQKPVCDNCRRRVMVVAETIGLYLQFIRIEVPQ